MSEGKEWFKSFINEHTRQIAELKDELRTVDFDNALKRANLGEDITEIRDGTNVWIQNYNQDLKELKGQLNKINDKILLIYQDKTPTEADVLIDSGGEKEQSKKLIEEFLKRIKKIVDYYLGDINDWSRGGIINELEALYHGYEGRLKR